MEIELDVQEREVIKLYAQQMATLFKRELSSRNATGADMMSVAFYLRLAEKMEGKGEPQ